MRLRWALVPICWVYSLLYSVQTFYTSIVLSFLTIVYNELGGHAGHWIIRNLSVAVCYGSFELGATLVACEYAYFDHLAQRANVRL